MDTIRMQKLAGLLKENDIDSLLNSINGFNSNDSEDGLNIGSNVSVIKYGAGTIVDIDDDNEMYIIELLDTKKEIKVPFTSVQPAKLPQELPIRVQNNIENLRDEYETFKKNVVGNLLTPDKEDMNSQIHYYFNYEKYKLPNIIDSYFALGKQLWDICKQYPEAVLYNDEFEDLFLDAIDDLVTINKLDEEQDEDLNKLIIAYRKISKIIGAGVY
jgi:hypothetical protein